MKGGGWDSSILFGSCEGIGPGLPQELASSTVTNVGRCSSVSVDESDGTPIVTTLAPCTLEDTRVLDGFEFVAAIWTHVGRVVFVHENHWDSKSESSDERLSRERSTPCVSKLGCAEEHDSSPVPLIGDSTLERVQESPPFLGHGGSFAVESESSTCRIPACNISGHLVHRPHRCSLPSVGEFSTAHGKQLRHHAIESGVREFDGSRHPS